MKLHSPVNPNRSSIRNNNRDRTVTERPSHSRKTQRKREPMMNSHRIAEFAPSDRRSRKLRSRRIFRRMTLLLLGFLFFATMRLPAAAAETENLVPATTNGQGEALAAQSCETNPFGNVHDIFIENEVFVGVTATFGFNPNLNGSLLDVMTNQFGSFLGEEWVYYEDSNANGLGLQAHDAAAADLDGDGYSDFIQTFTNSSNQWYLAHYTDPTPAYFKVSDNLYNPIAASAGHISSVNTFAEQAVLAGVDQVSGKVNLLLWDGTTSGGDIVIQGRWSSTTGGRQFAGLLDTAIGDFNGDTDDEIAVLMEHSDGGLELVVLDYDPNHDQGSGDDVEYHLKPIASLEIGSNTPSKIIVLAGRIDADHRNDIVVIHNASLADDPTILLSTYELDATNTEIVPINGLDTTITYPYSGGPFEMGAGLGEIDGDLLRDEIALGYPAEDGIHIKVFKADRLDDPVLPPHFETIHDWSVAGVPITQLNLAVGDLDNQSPDEIIAAYENSANQLEVTFLDQGNLTDNTNTHANAYDPNGLNTPVAIAMGDADGDSVRAVYSGDCQQVREDNVTSVVYRPPLWQNIQPPDQAHGRGFIGETEGGGTSTAMQLGSSRSTTTSGYVGIGIEAEYGVASFEASSRVTMSEEYSQGIAQGTEESSSVSLSIRHGAYDNFAVFDEQTYNCYGYEVIQNNVVVTDTTTLRSCELDVNLSAERSATLDSRDILAVISSPSVNQALEWVPTIRDWASIALFRDSFTAQSSTSGGGAAGKAVDGILDGVAAAMTATNVEDYPWWEVDLGQAEVISTIRLWHNDQDSCAPNDCAAQLKDVYVFVSDSPFSPGDTPADLIANPDIHSYSMADISQALSGTVGPDFPAGRVTTFLTLEPSALTAEPIMGRYVRVQIDRTQTQLNLAEVQVFGTHHVEPNRYPVDVRPGPAGADYFEAQLYNPHTNTYLWIQVRGELLWNGLKNDLTPIVLVVPIGGADTEWSRTSSTATESFSSRTVSEQKSVGFEFDLSAGAIVMAQGGFGMDWSTGVFSETTHSTFWSENFEIGGWFKGFPQGAEGLYDTCDYSVRPFYYQVTEESTFGYKTTHTVMDYVVPAERLDRTQDHTDCLVGHVVAADSNAASDQATGTAGGSIFVPALVNDAGTTDLRIISVDNPANGSVTFTDTYIIYTPDGGFVGEETFNYVIGDDVTSSSASVTVTVDPHLIFLPLITH